MTEPTREQMLGLLDHLIEFYAGYRLSEPQIEKLEAIRALIQSSQPPRCKTCGGRGFVMRSASTESSGGAWNEPCPECPMET